MSEPYIKRLERVKDSYVDLLKTMEEWSEADHKARNTAYRGDAIKAADKLKAELDRKISEAKKTLGGMYA